jgi:photosystem II stability/assembly factor-like uncharacterized protein
MRSKRALGVACFMLFTAIAAAQPVTLVHVHGLAYSGDGKRLMVPSHHGLAVYEAGKWSKAPGPAHDYMGFAATRDRLYSSGHPAPGSGLVNPFGLIRSKDGGKSWEKLGLEGETDFHLLATSWNTNAVYAWNPAPSSRLPANGLHYTLDDGRNWKRAAATGLTGEPGALAVHPDDPRIVAVATRSGIHLSSDAGERFTQIRTGAEGLAVLFDFDGTTLWYSVVEGQPRIERVAVRGGAATEIRLPRLERDAVAHIAQNPAARQTYAIATFRRSVYLSRDAGKSWQAIAREGAGL